jgi:protein-L-isoaspartate(D-aspartate) O-methyltransferase
MLMTVPSTDVEANDRMIREQIVARGIRDPRILAAFQAFPRAQFVPAPLRTSAYEDGPLPLELEQTISQPYIVARMTELLGLRGDERVLEIGTGSGYQTAILARLCEWVYSAELEHELSASAFLTLARAGVTNVLLAVGDGLEIFRPQAPFDAIISAAAPLETPEVLIEQLADGGRCVLPAGSAEVQYLWKIEKRGGKVIRTRHDAVRFVPLRAVPKGSGQP